MNTDEKYFMNKNTISEKEKKYFPTYNDLRSTEMG